MPTSLRGIANRAKDSPRHIFGGLYSWLDQVNLSESFRQLKRDAAPGVDNLDYYAYQAGLGRNLVDLVGRLKQETYRARLVRRKYIPKANGKLRPLGIPVVEDKLLQHGVARLLGAIYEQDFLSCSYGYRPGRGPQQAAHDLQRVLQDGRFGWVVEADIKGFFDNMQHDILLSMLQMRVNDGPVLRLIQKWLKAGVLEATGEVIHPITGTPQGGVISPILANIYLHYALDRWFDQVVRKRCRGQAMLIRYADDFVCAFQLRSDATWFYKELGQRLGRFGLELAAEKTRLLRFSRFALGGERFDFLGFEFQWCASRNGHPIVFRRTSKKKLQVSIANFTDWIRTRRHSRTRTIMRTLGRKLIGYWNYYGVRGNYDRLQYFYHIVMQILFKWLNRRSERRSYTREGFRKMVELHQVPPPRIVETRRVA